MHPGNVLFVFTDGITEANDGKKHFYGTDNLLDALNSSASTDPDALIAAVEKGIAEFTADTEQFDDQTMKNINIC